MRHLDHRSDFPGPACVARFMAAGLALLLCALACHAQPADAASEPHAVSPGRDDSWGQLTAPQQRVLEPLKNVWPSMTDARQRKWRLIADRMGTLPPDAQQRLRSRMAGWAKLTAGQRAEARMAYLQARSGRASSEPVNKRTMNAPAAGLKPVSPGVVQVTPGATTILVHSPARRGARR